MSQQRSSPAPFYADLIAGRPESALLQPVAVLTSANPELMTAGGLSGFPPTWQECSCG